MTGDWKQRRPPFAFRWFLPGFELALSAALVLHWMISVFLPGAWASRIQLIVPAALNLPAGLLLSRIELVPRGIRPELWCSVVWPVAGTVFWWIVGRAWEGLAAARRRSLLPAVTWIELLIGTVLMIILGAGGVSSIMTSHRSETTMYAVGGLLWGALGLSVVAARLVQERLRKQMRKELKTKST